MGVHRFIHSRGYRAGYSSPYFWNLESIMKRKRKAAAAAPTLSALERYNLQRAQEAQTAHGGKPVQTISTRARYNEHRESKYIN